jgi:hypothetical protein
MHQWIACRRRAAFVHVRIGRLGFVGRRDGIEGSLLLRHRLRGRGERFRAFFVVCCFQLQREAFALDNELSEGRLEEEGARSQKSRLGLCHASS